MQGLRQDVYRIYRHVATETAQEMSYEGIHAPDVRKKSLDRISAALHINKKTAFDWRHKILRSLKQYEGVSFSGITESDETFFDKSDKGCRHLKRKPRKRGGEVKGKGISTDKATVIVTADRKTTLI